LHAGVLQAVYAPRWRTRRLEPRAALAAAAPRHAMIIGAGLAGAACAHALAVRGWTVDVLDAAGAAAGASALPAGLAHARVSPDDDRLARLGRAGLAALLAAIPEPQRAALWQGGGLLLAESASEFAALTAIAAALALPPSVAEVVDAGDASLRAAAQVSQGGWWPAGGVAAASSLVRAWLATPGVRLQGACRVHRVYRVPDAAKCHAPGACMQAAGTFAGTLSDSPSAAQTTPLWQALDETGRVLAQAPVCIVAIALDTARLLDASHLNPGGQSLPLRPQAGQAFLVPAAALPQLSGLQRPLVGDAYVLPLPAAALQALPNAPDSNDATLTQAPWLLLGATYEDDPNALMPREAAWAHIVAGLAPLVGTLPPAPPAAARLFQGVRAVAHDRLPCAGPWPDWTALASAKPGALHRPADELPPLPGLYLSTAMGSRGLTLAALAAACIATHLEGEPAPLERDLIAALAPGRFGLRRALREGLGSAFAR
jgi:tRNA 5-methylaminomethyl-2-thiouridine biosynthesis bifunctional protein